MSGLKSDQVFTDILNLERVLQNLEVAIAKRVSLILTPTEQGA